jgi:hypothetical protein
MQKLPKLNFSLEHYRDWLSANPHTLPACERLDYEQIKKYLDSCKTHGDFPTLVWYNVMAMLVMDSSVGVYVVVDAGGCCFASSVCDAVDLSYVDGCCVGGVGSCVGGGGAAAAGC